MVRGILPPSATAIAKRVGIDEREVKKLLRIIKKSTAPLTQRISVLEDGVPIFYNVTRSGVGIIQTKFGDFWLYDFSINDRWRKYSVLLKGNIDENNLRPVLRKRPLLMRIDSGCETGQLFHDLTCECGEQLEMAMDLVAKNGEGMIINIPRQDGRGMGLPFKLATLWAQKAFQLNTVESASILSQDGIIDRRTYGGVICILKFLGIDSSMPVNLATNNPDKTRIFAENGYRLENTIPVKVQPNKYTRSHLAAKKKYLGHRL